jgi:hypothetical protein
MDMSRALSRARFVVGGAFLAATAALLYPTGEPAAQPTTEALPTPKDFVSGLDLECFATQGPALNLGIQLTHLNPVLLALGLPSHDGVIRELTETCVPVMKNGVSPSSTALPFIQHVDFACYRLESPALVNPPSITLAHLNPVLAQFPRHNVKLLQPDELCLPVMKNNVVPPAEVLDLVRYLDLECWNVAEDPHSVFTLALRQLNPQLVNIPQHNMTLDTSPRKLCVPVRKNQQVIPAASLNIIRWVDLERFTARPPVVINPVTVVLRHLNPLFTTLAPITVVLQTAQALMVPVSKNNNNPP